MRTHAKKGSKGPLLISAFEPFGGDRVNCSEKVLAAFRNSDNTCGSSITTCILPVDGRSATQELIGIVEREAPSAIVCLGQGTGRNEISIEKVAVNYCAYEIPDNAGAKPVDQPVLADGPVAYFSSLPILQILDDLHAQGLEAKMSLSAGAYVCNFVFYSLMHYLVTSSKNVPAGFIHLPALPEQARSEECPCVPLDRQVAVIQAIMRAVVRYTGLSASDARG